ncbi:hypothetical protein ES702_07308 [subsurface metagenome]
MKERLLDVIKWGLILIIAGAVFYVVYPKYYFNNYKGLWTRGNKMTGKIEVCSGFRGLWQELGKHQDEMGIIWDKSTPIEPKP